VTKDYHPLHPTQLLLRYPEVYWLFIVSNRRAVESQLQSQTWLQPAAQVDQAAFSPLIAEIIDSHFVSITALFPLFQQLIRHAAGFRTVFDPTGLRSAVISASAGVQAPTASMLEPGKYGLSQEDEIGYCLFNGYVLYRSGCHTYLAPTLVEYLKTISRMKTLPGRWHIIEDAELSYDDATLGSLREHHLMPSVNETRTEEKILLDRSRHAGLDRAECREIVSVVKLNCEEIQRQSGTQQVNCIIKPYHGLYDPELQHKPRLTSRHGGVWGAVRSHSAPGRNQEAATHLLRRCRRGVQSLSSPEDALHLAVLADVALQLLHGGTIHLSLEALALRHTLEAQAECQFMGTSSALDIDGRMRDIAADVKQIIWHGESSRSKEWKRKQQQGNAMLRICSELRDVYETYDLLDEVDIVLNWFRTWKSTLFVNGREDWREPGGLRRLERLGSTFLRHCAACVWRYINFIISSWRRIISASAAWILLFALMFFIIAENAIPERTARFNLGYFHWCKHSAATFVALQQHLDGGISGEHMTQAIEDAVQKRRSIESRMQTILNDLSQKPAPVQPISPRGAGPADANDEARRRQLASVMSEHWSAVLERDRLLRWMKWWWFFSVSELMIGFGHAGILIAVIVQKFSRK
jgi:hypothetical protein